MLTEHEAYLESKLLSLRFLDIIKEKLIELEDKRGVDGIALDNIFTFSIATTIAGLRRTFIKDNFTNEWLERIFKIAKDIIDSDIHELKKKKNNV